MRRIRARYVNGAAAEAIEWRGVPSPLDPQFAKALSLWEALDAWLEDAVDLTARYHGSEIVVKGVDGIKRVVPGDYVVRFKDGAVRPVERANFERDFVEI